MKLSSGFLLHLEEKEQLGLSSCFGKERSNLALHESTGSLAAVFGTKEASGVCTARNSSTIGAAVCQPHRDWR